jgi:hypothetical protein
MKIKLTPKISYLVGLWKYARTSEGLGVQGSEELQQAFLSAAINAGVASADKIQIKENKTFFYHSAYRAFFEKTLLREDEAFCHANDYAAAFLAGLFDAVGGVHDGQTGLSRADKRDEIVLLRLNFRAKKASGVVWIAPADQFLKFIKAFTRVDHLDAAPPKLETERSKLGGNNLVGKSAGASTGRSSSASRTSSANDEPPKRRRRIYPDPPAR